MLDCHSCLSRCLRAIIASANSRAPSSLPSTATSVFLTSSNLTWPQCTRNLTRSSPSLLQCRSFHNSPTRAARPAKRPKYTTTNYEADPELIETSKSKRWRNHDQDILAKASWQAPLTGAEARRLGKLKLHNRAKAIKDPYDLLEYVKAALASGASRDDVETVIRKVSYQCNTVVSWNYYIAHIFNMESYRGKIGAAGRAFLMMKKCAIEPDSHTYMALHVGLLKAVTESPHVGPTAAKRSTSIYHGLSLPHSKTKNSTMLLNATLNVCARAGEMGMIWGIAAKIPETGEGAADEVTYSIILNAMRNNLQKPASGSKDVFERAIVDAKGIWAEVISKHRAGQLAIDSTLVGAMGRVLLMGKNKQDWDNVFALFEQTMDIPRIFPAIDAGEALIQERPRVGTFGAEPRNKKRGDVVEDPSKDVFKPLDSKKKPGAAVSPSNNTLSLALETCNKLANRAGADAYWKLFTDPRGFGLTPDLDNVHSMLRLYKEEGDSRAALDLLQKFLAQNSDSAIEGVTFRIALGSCKRVRTKVDSFADATAIVDLMLQHIPVPDYRTLVWYSELALQQKTPQTFPFAIERLTKGMHAIEKGNKQVGFITKADGLDAPVTSKVNDGQNVLLALIKMIDISFARHQRDPETISAWRELRNEAQDNLHDILHEDEEHVQLFGSSIDRKKSLAGAPLKVKLEELAEDRRRHQENVRSLAAILDKPFGDPYQSRRRSWKIKPSGLRNSRVMPEKVFQVGRASDVKTEERQELKAETNPPPIRERRPATSESDPPLPYKGFRSIRNPNSALEAAEKYAGEKARGAAQ